MPQWSAIRFQPHRENLARRELERIGYQVYLPRIRVRRFVRGRKVDAEPLLFPGYGFLVIELQWHAARYCCGVANLIMDGIRPARVPDDVIAKLRASERDGVVVLPKRPKPQSKLGFREGDRLRIKSGPLSGIYGLFSGMSAHDRVVVLLQWMGSSRPVEFERDNVVRA